MTAQIPDVFPPLPFRTCEGAQSSSKSTNWNVLGTFVRRNSPSLATPQFAEAIAKLDRNRKIITDTINEASSGSLTGAAAFQTKITESFITSVVKEYLELLFFAQAHFPLTGAAGNDEKANKRSAAANTSVSGLQFTWTVYGEPSVKNSTTKGNVVTSMNANFEACSVLLNAAMCWGRIAQQQVWQYGTEGAKSAFKYFQAAAGIASQLSSLVSSLEEEAKEDGADPNLARATQSLAVADLSPRGLQFLERLFLACAHHCGYLQALGRMPTNYVLLSKMAMDGCNLYKQVVGLIKEARAYEEYLVPNGDGKSMSGPAGLNTEYSCILAHVMLEAKAQYHLAQLDFQDKPDKPVAPGSGVGRLNRVLDLLEYAQKSLLKVVSGQERSWCEGFRVLVQAEHTRAMKDIELVYMGERILKSVPEPEANNKPLGKPTPSDLYMFPTDSNGESGSITSSGVNTKARDPFFGVVPLHILGPINDYRNKVRTMVSQCSESLASHRQRVRERMNAMGVSGAIQVALGSDGETKSKLPKDMRAKIFLLRQRALDAASPVGSRQNSSSNNRPSGNAGPSENDSEQGHLLDCLVNQLDHGQNVAEHINQRLAEMLREMDEEKHNDEVMVTQYGNKLWRDHRKPADTLPEGSAFRRAAQEFQTALAKWVRDPLDRSKKILQANLQDVSRLDWPMVDLDALMPFMDGHEAKQQTEQVKQIGRALKELSAEVENLFKASESKLADLRILVDSDNVACMLSCAPRSRYPKILEEAQKDFAQGINEVSANRNRMDFVCDKQIADAMEKLATVESNDALSDEVRALCRSLEASITTIETISEDVIGACRFADTLSEQVEQTYLSCRSFVVGRKMEAEELAREIDEQVNDRIAHMKHREGAEQEAEESRRRQAELMARIQSLESGNPPGVTTNNSSSGPSSTNSYAYQPSQQQQVPSYNGGGGYATAHQGQPTFSDDGFPTLPPPTTYSSPPQNYQPPQQNYQPPPQQQQPWWQQHTPQSVNQGANPNVRY